MNPNQHCFSLSINSLWHCITGSLFLFFFSLLPAHATLVPIYEPKRASAGPGGSDADAGSGTPSLSDDGRYIAFSSAASNLVSGDVNGVRDIFVYDTTSGSIERVSTDAGGIAGNGDSFGPAISGDGRFVAFTSDATNLNINDSNAARDIFVKDRETGAVVLASVSSTDVQGDGNFYNLNLSGDGQLLAFESDSTNLVDDDSNGFFDIFVRDLAGQTTERVSLPFGAGETNEDSGEPWLSKDGKFIVFRSEASNIIETDANGTVDIFRRDLIAGTTILVSQNSNSVPGNGYCQSASVSSDGNLVAYTSDADNLDLIVPDTNGVSDVFVRDITAGTTVRITVSESGVESNDYSYTGAISASGQHIVFSTEATNLVGFDTNGLEDVYRFDRNTGKLSLVSHNTLGGSVNGYSTEPVVSSTGVTGFVSQATDLGPPDADTFFDIYVEGRGLYAAAERQAQIAVLKRKIKAVKKQISKIKKSIRNSRRSGNTSKVKFYSKQLKSAQADLKSLIKKLKAL